MNIHRLVLPNCQLLKKFWTRCMPTSTKLNMEEMDCGRLLFSGEQYGGSRWSITLSEGLATSSSFVEKTSTTTDPSPHLRILFKGGKNDQYTEGGERVVASNPDVKRCPVQLTLNYFRFLGLSYDGYLVPLCTAKNSPNPAKSVPYSGALTDLKKLMNLLGYDEKLYGEHSGKRGGATTAAAHGATDKQLKRLGG